MRIFFLLITLLITVSCFCQTDENKIKIDTLKAQLKRDSLKIYHFQKIRPTLGIDNRNSFIKNNPVNLNGIQIGVVYKENNTFGIGFYSITANSKIKGAAKVIDNKSTIVQTLKMGYVTFYYQPALIDKKHFELDLPVEIGLGRFTLNRTDSATGKVLKPITSGIIPIGVGLMGIYKPWKIIGLSYLMGYRIATAKDISFSGAYYSFGVWFDVRQMIRNTRFYLVKKKKYKKELKKLSV
jgi:hypothetical protein